MPQPAPSSIHALAAFVGRHGTIVTTTERLTVEVTVADARVTYGVTQFLVTPVSGRGSAWVYKDRVELEPEP